MRGECPHKSEAGTGGKGKGGKTAGKELRKAEAQCGGSDAQAAREGRPPAGDKDLGPSVAQVQAEVLKEASQLLKNLQVKAVKFTQDIVKRIVEGPRTALLDSGPLLVFVALKERNQRDASGAGLSLRAAALTCGRLLRAHWCPQKPLRPLLPLTR